MEIITPKDIKNAQYHLIGEAFIVLNFARHKLLGYKTPRPFSTDQFDRSVDYDFKVVENWVKYLSYFSKKSSPLKDKSVLELGVGPDLGTGLILLALGAKKYSAMDVNELAKSTPEKLYEKLFGRLKYRWPQSDIGYLKEQLDKCYRGEGDTLNYIVDKNFEISKIRDKFDIVFSQAAFEHFTDIRKTFEELSSAVRDGGILVTEIDLKTHTRWIRDRDPLNIYRYNDLFYNLFRFKGSPNRVRAFEYKELLEEFDWSDIKIEPLTVLEDDCVEKIKPSLNKKFRKVDSSEMKILSVMLMAKRK